MEKVRIDKWLWAIRFFKTRSQATDACKSGHVSVKDQAAKPSLLIGPGVFIDVKKNGITYTLEVLNLLEKRVGAPIAVTCYKDHTPESELRKFELWYAAQSGRAEIREKGAGRPTKKERRIIDDFKGI